MALPTASVLGATSGSTVLLNKHHTAQVTSHIRKLAHTGAASPHTLLGADTIGAGTTSLLISLAGADTLGAVTIGGHTHGGTHHGAGGGGSSPLAATPAGGIGPILASAGNQTLTGGLGAPPANGPQPGTTDIGTFAATVFGAALAGSVVVFDHGRAHAVVPAHTGGSGTTPDLLVGWSAGQAGYTIDLGKGPAAPLPSSDPAVVSMGEMPRRGVIDIVFGKPT